MVQFVFGIPSLDGCLWLADPPQRLSDLTAAIGFHEGLRDSDAEIVAATLLAQIGDFYHF